MDLIFTQIFVVGSERRIFFAIDSAYQAFKIIQGRWVWQHSKGCMRLPVSH